MILHYYFGEQEFDFEISYKEVVKAICENYCDDDKNAISCLESFIYDNNFDLSDYEDFLKEYYEDEARICFDDQQAEIKDPLGVLGLSERDFL